MAAKHHRTPVIAELLLRPAGAPLRYQPGQYVLLGAPDAQLVARSYSIANAQRRDGLISLLVTRGSTSPERPGS
ncbi:MAG TPA: FAD-binding oxidoreductase [Streptosporangiaceae bacterium]|nr:FAD-binding oxidoreductase [Streptosporangiaceae bacterium]